MRVLGRILYPMKGGVGSISEARHDRSKVNETASLLVNPDGDGDGSCASP